MHVRYLITIASSNVFLLHLRFIYTPHDGNSKLVVSLLYIPNTIVCSFTYDPFYEETLQRYLSLYKRRRKREYTGIGKIELSLPL